MTDQKQASEDADADGAATEQADIDDSDHADGTDVFGDLDPEDLDADLDEEADDDSDDTEDAETTEDEETNAATPPASTDASDAAAALAEGDVSLGHVYCRGLGVATALAVDRCGDDADPRSREEIIEEYSGLAKQMEIDQYIDQHMAHSGGMESLSPGQTAVLLTGAMAVLVAVSEPAVTDAALDGIELPTDSLPI